MDKEIKDRILKLRQIINKQNDLYFQQQGENHIYDVLYDQLLSELITLEKQYPQYDDKNSPTHKVGGKAENTFDEVKHIIPMLSLGKVMNWKEFEAWFNDMIKKGVKEFILELKYDGLAISLLYENGKLIRGATRGNGEIGEDITATILTIPNIPKQISTHGVVEIRGEVVLLKSGLEEINNTLGKNYKNVRNAASGILRTKNPSYEAGKHLRFAPYMLSSNDLILDSHSTSLNELKKLGFLFENNYVQELKFNIKEVNDNIDEALKYIKEQYFKSIEEVREHLDFDIDGIVIKANLYKDQQSLGNKTNIPNWAIAYKFEAQEKIAILEDVEWLLGSKGNITPRARITPVEIGGTTVTKPTLHNIDEIKRLGIMIGDHIIVSRRGDVIPKIERVLTELRTGNEKEILIPIVCPECGEPITQHGVFIRCDNSNCGGRQAFKIENYINAVEIDEFGPKVIEKLIEVGKIDTLVDIYKLKIDDIACLERMGQKSAVKIIDNIEKSKSAPLEKIIAGLTIKNVGIRAGKDLAKKYTTLEAFSNAKIEELMNIEGMGDVISNNIVTWLNNKSNKDILNQLIEFEIGLNISEEKIKSSIKLNNKNFAFTGTLSISRKQMENIIIDNGGEIFGIKKGIDYLIIGAGAKDDKINKAKKLGAEIITEIEFNQLLS